MTPQCHIRLESFKKNFFNGFIRLQHDEEFVDMTLAAGGHLVKVHKNILALASPYIKEVLQTTPCSHPVVFLPQIKKEILGYLLEYVYTGEVQVPTIRMASFIEAAKALHIIGLENMIPPMYSASYQSEVLQSISKRNKTAQKRIHSINRVPQTTAETNCMQPTVKYLREHIPVKGMDEDKSIIQKNNSFDMLQTSQTIQSCEQLQNMEISDTNQRPTQEIYNENCTNYQKEIKIDLDSTEPNLQSENSTSDIVINNVTTATYNNDIQNVKELWSEDGTVNVMDYTSEEAKDFEQNIVCPGTITSDENNIKNTEIVTALDSNQTTLFDIEAVINSAVISVDSFSKNSQQSTYNDCVTGREMDTNLTEEALLEPIAPHNNQHFSFEITTSGAENDTGKPMTITINPIEIEPKKNTKTTDIALTHDCSSPLYTVSKRGRLMLILNRYMYNLHNSSKCKRRWRCINYYCRGKQSCKAYIDTENEMVISRKFIHDHPFHDKKIFTKGHAGNIYTSIKDASNQMQNVGI